MPISKILSEMPCLWYQKEQCKDCKTEYNNFNLNENCYLKKHYTNLNLNCGSCIDGIFYPIAEGVLCCDNCGEKK